MSKHVTHAKAAKKNLPQQPQHGQPVMAADTSALPPSLAKQIENLFHKHGKHDASHHHHQPATDASGDTYLIHSAAATDSGADNGAASGAVVSDASGSADPSIVLTGGTVGAVSPAEAEAAPALAPAPIEAAPVVAAPAGIGFPGALLGGLALAGLAAAAGGGGGGGGSTVSAAGGSGSASGGPTPAAPTPTPVVTTTGGGSESTSTTGVTVTPTTGATVTGVTVTGVSATCPGDIITVTATAGADNTYTFDATQFANGPLNVIVTEQLAGGAQQSTTVVLDKDTAAVSINGHEYLAAADVATDTALTINHANNVQITGVTVTGTDANGHPLTETATVDANGQYHFDATQFADGALSVSVAETDASGNALPDTVVQLVKDTSVVTVSGSPYLNVDTATADASLTVTADQNATISTVTVTGTDANGNALTESATLDADGKFHFDATRFADGNLTVHVVENSNGTTVAHDVTIIKDTSVPAAVGTDTGITLHDVDANGQATLAAHVVGNEHITGVTVAGMGMNGQPLTEAATIDTSGKIHFNAAPFADGTLTLMISAANPAGNQETNTLTITKDLSIVNVGGDNILSAGEINADHIATLTINPPVEGGENVSIGTVTVMDANGHTVTATEGANGQYTFDTSTLVDGPLAVAIQETSANCPPETEIVQLIKDTSPLLVHLDSNNTVSVNNDCGQIGNATLTIHPAADAVVTGVTVTGTGLNGQPLTETATVDANGQYHFDASQFTNGNVTVSVTEQGVATPLTQVIGLNTATVTAGIEGILDTAAATQHAALTIVSGVGEHLSDIVVTVSGTDASGNPVSAPATLDSDGKFHFDATKFADGGLTVHVVENSHGATVTHDVMIIKDTSVPAAVSTDTHLTLNDVDAHGQATLVAHVVGNEHITGAAVAGVGLNGQPLTEAATIDASGKIHFNAAPFADGTLTLMISAANPATGNQEVNTLTITKDLSIVNAGGDHVLSANEISNGTATLTITPSVEGGEHVTIGTVTVSGVDANGQPVTVTATEGANGQYTFDASQLADGLLTVAVPETSAGCLAETETVQLIKDTTPLVHLDSVNTLSIDNDCGQIGNATLTIHPAADAVVTGVTVIGTGLNGQPLTETATVDANGQYHFDASQFANGNVTVSVTEQGVATPLTQVIGLNTATVTAGVDGVLDASQDTDHATLNIVAGAGEHLTDIVATVTGLDIDGHAHTEKATLGDDGKFHFNAKVFEDGKLMVHVVENSNGAGDHTVAIIKDTSHVLGGVLGLDAGTATDTATLQIVPGADQTIEAVKVTGIGLDGTPLTETATLDANGHYQFDATPFADGQLHVSITETDCAGVEMDHTLTITKDDVTTPITVTDGDATIHDADLSATATTYNFTHDGDVIHLVATDHDVVNLIGGHGTVSLDVDPASLLFAELSGNASGSNTDTLSLNADHGTLNLSLFNTADKDHVVLQHFEHINLKANGHETVILSAHDLFNEHSDFTIGGHSAVVINGDASDTVNVGDLAQQAGSFDASGHASANGNYNLYIGSAVDSHGTHQVDLLLQHSMQVTHA